MSSLVRTLSSGGGGPPRQVRRVERPRPLKMSLSLENTVVLVEAVTKQLSSGNYDRSIRSSIVNMSSNVKRLGPQLETQHKERLDALQGGLRTACRY